MPDEIKSGMQNTGNPVLDSVVNLVCSGRVAAKVDEIKIAHDLLLELAAKELGGLKVHAPAVVVQKPAAKASRKAT